MSNLMASARCCEQEQLFQHQTTGETVCLAHAQTRVCEDCGDGSIERCHLTGCGQWVCLDPLVEFVLRQEFYVTHPRVH